MYEVTENLLATTYSEREYFFQTTFWSQWHDFQENLLKALLNLRGSNWSVLRLGLHPRQFSSHLQILHVSSTLESCGRPIRASMT